ncbi:hypothetical protein STLA111740_21185 [Stenotrophomonas lactitubi]
MTTAAPRWRGGPAPVRRTGRCRRSRSPSRCSAGPARCRYARMHAAHRPAASSCGRPPGPAARIPARARWRCRSPPRRCWRQLPAPTASPPATTAGAHTPAAGARRAGGCRRQPRYRALRSCWPRRPGRASAPAPAARSRPAAAPAARPAVAGTAAPHLGGGYGRCCGTCCDRWYCWQRPAHRLYLRGTGLHRAAFHPVRATCCPLPGCGCGQPRDPAPARPGHRRGSPAH